jgi:hypothetical protein
VSLSVGTGVAWQDAACRAVLAESCGWVAGRLVALLLEDALAQAPSRHGSSSASAEEPAPESTPETQTQPVPDSAPQRALDPCSPAASATPAAGAAAAEATEEQKRRVDLLQAPTPALPGAGGWDGGEVNSTAPTASLCGPGLQY